MFVKLKYKEAEYGYIQVYTMILNTDKIIYVDLKKDENKNIEVRYEGVDIERTLIIDKRSRGYKELIKALKKKRLVMWKDEEDEEILSSIEEKNIRRDKELKKGGKDNEKRNKTSIN